MSRLAPFAEQVVGIDPDPEAIVYARQRISPVSNVSLVVGDFLTMPVPSPEEPFSLVTCVATLHHMELRSAPPKCAKCSHLVASPHSWSSS
ncbi:class I SAM-dependent methyltransferase [Alicyclobacillus sp. ALC3]|uniref:class I SAM-dependent methyltransferase n=1 Tax=Alicyclobacillus sp. ALC3 TaxID=2796143 RepID=UPI0027A532C7|nr:class I SAM-dependent methyltransferase [Alicyclobacillus sp. ALC3]